MSKSLASDIIQAIGKNHPKDYELQLHEHIPKYEESLPRLIEVLSSSQNSTLAREFHKHEKEAISFHTEFRSKSRRVRQLGFATTVFATILCMLSGLILIFRLEGEQIQNIIPPLTMILGVLGAITGAGAGVYLNMIKGNKLLETWMQKRAQAEEYRLRYFESVTSLPEKGQTKFSQEEVLERLEYFRRYQLGIQMNYYAGKSEKLFKISTRNLNQVALLLGGVALVNALAGAFESTLSSSDTVNNGWSSLAGLALIIQAYSTLINNRDLSEQNLRNASRYENTRSLLSQLNGKLDKVRESIISGKHEILPRFVEAVHEPLSSENRQWLENVDKQHSAISRLEEFM